jgi:hypothetical protein
MYTGRRPQASADDVVSNKRARPRHFLAHLNTSGPLVDRKIVGIFLGILGTIASNARQHG